MKRIFFLFNAVGRQRRETNGGHSTFGEIRRISFVGLAHKNDSPHSENSLLKNELPKLK